MTYATRSAARSGSKLRAAPAVSVIRTRKIVGYARSLARTRAPAQCSRGNRWLMAAPGSHTFFHKPPSQPPTSRLFYIVPRFQRLIFPIVPQRISRQSAPSPPLPPRPLSSLHLLLFLLLPHSFYGHWLSPSRPSLSLSAVATPQPRPRFHPSPEQPVAFFTVDPRSPHCHWQTDLNGGIKSIRFNRTRYIPH